MGKIRVNRKKEDAREIILRGALELVGEQGLKALSARNLSKKTEMSVSNLYHHFRDMDEIMVDASIYYLEWLYVEAFPADVKSLEDYYIRYETAMLNFLENNKTIAHGYKLIAASNYVSNPDFKKTVYGKLYMSTGEVSKTVSSLLPKNITEEDKETFVLGLNFVCEGMRQSVVSIGLKPAYLKVYKKMLKMMIREIIEKYN